MRKLFTITIFILFATTTFAQLQAWNFDNGTNAPTTNAPGVTGNNAIFSGVGVASYITGFKSTNPPTFAGGLAYANDDWATTAAYDAAKYFEISVTATGDNLDFTFLELAIRRDANGPKKIELRTSADTYASAIHTIDLSSTENFIVPNISLSTISDVSDLTIRFYGYDASTIGGLLVFDEIAFTKIDVLPVELAYLKGKVNHNTTSLEWATYSEENNAYFEVLHSVNGVGFEAIERIEGAGNTVEYNHYQFTHKNPENGSNYYRLRQVDFDGTVSLTDIVLVEHNIITTADIKIFPNPTVDYVNIQLPQNEISTNVIIYNINGQIEKNISNIYDNNIQLNVSNWLSGQYIVVIQQGNQKITTQFVKF